MLSTKRHSPIYIGVPEEHLNGPKPLSVYIRKLSKVCRYVGTKAILSGITKRMSIYYQLRDIIGIKVSDPSILQYFPSNDYWDIAAMPEAIIRCEVVTGTHMPCYMVVRGMWHSAETGNDYMVIASRYIHNDSLPFATNQELCRSIVGSPLLLIPFKELDRVVD